MDIQSLLIVNYSRSSKSRGVFQRPSCIPFFWQREWQGQSRFVSLLGGSFEFLKNRMFQLFEKQFRTKRMARVPVLQKPQRTPEVFMM
jgi:hypothetical protein